MEKSEDMWQVMAKVLSNEASQLERQTLQLWLAESSERQEMWEDARLVWQQRQIQLPVFDSRKAWQKFSNLLDESV
jgi:ferric-dicitrate binding protein FerR (iron transport regulator)